jgi:hypothetical protein
MKSRVLFLLAFAVSSVNVSGQNLVPNGSFEEYSECPLFLGELESKCDFWFGSIVNPNVPIDQNPTPDWYHSCGINAGMQPPDVAVGYQLPNSGNGMAGFLIFRINGTLQREVVGVPLIEPLEIENEYVVKFSLVCDGELGNSAAVSKIGFRFTTFPTFNSTEEIVDDFAHGTIDEVVSDTLNWNTFEFSFTADSAYEYLHIGHFFSGEFVDTLLIEGSIGINSYYFFDDVSVEASSLNANYLSNAGRFKLFPNPVINEFQIEHPTNLKIESIEIMDTTGKRLIRFDGNQNIYNVSNLKEGLYFAVIRLKGNRSITKQFVKFKT